MSVMSDAIITYAILRKFVTPIKETEAYRRGLIDDEGRPTERGEHVVTEGDRDAYTLLDRLVFKLKRIFKSMPAAAKLIGGYATALAFIKESALDEDFDADEFAIFEKLDNSRADYWYNVVIGEQLCSFDELNIVRHGSNDSLIRKIVEAMLSEDGESSVAQPAGNTVSQVQGLATEPVFDKKTQKKWVDSNVANGRKIEVIQKD